MSVWSTAEINNFPDSSFAFIAPGGTKDDDGKTVPRTLRKLPYKDGQGNVDLPHVRNGLARLNQTDGIPADKKASIQAMFQKLLASQGKEKADRLGLTATSLKLDANGALPTRFPLFVTGEWPNSVKGNFKVTLDDLKEMKANFEQGIGFPTEDASTGLAIDFAHNYRDMAAAWIKGLQLEIDSADPAKGTLYADPVEWTDAGTEAVQGGQFKCVSPMGAFGSKSGKLSLWTNPNNLKEKIANVIEGAGLTNIPFLRGMSPIRADRLDNHDTDNGNVVYIAHEQKTHKQEPIMTLDEVRVKERKDLTVPELDLLTEHKDELSADEQKKFQLDAVEEVDPISDEDRATLDAIKSGEKKLIDKDQKVATDGEVTVPKEQLDALQATAEDYRDEKAQAIVDGHVKRGAIKQDTAENWKKRLLSADKDEREALEKDLEGLPDNQTIADEIGTAEDVSAGSTAREQLTALANEKVKAAAKEGKELLFGDALKQVGHENPDLANEDAKDQINGGKK